MQSKVVAGDIWSNRNVFHMNCELDLYHLTYLTEKKPSSIIQVLTKCCSNVCAIIFFQLKRTSDTTTVKWTHPWLLGGLLLLERYDLYDRWFQVVFFFTPDPCKNVPIWRWHIFQLGWFNQAGLNFVAFPKPWSFVSNIWLVKPPGGCCRWSTTTTSFYWVRYWRYRSAMWCGCGLYCGQHLCVSSCFCFLVWEDVTWFF